MHACLAELATGLNVLLSAKSAICWNDAISELEEQIPRSDTVRSTRKPRTSLGVLLQSASDSGRPIKTMDALIASIALVHRATLATRDISDFEQLGLALVNPFAPAPE